MKFKVLSSIVVAITTIIILTSCSDTVDSIGESIQPGSDGMLVEIDSVRLTAKTVELDERFFSKVDKTLLGMITDPVFGTQKADFLTEFSCNKAEFLLGDDGKATVDSVRFEMPFLNSDFIGDSIKPMAITIYGLTKNLKSDYYTDVNTEDYCDKKTILGQRFFSMQNLRPFAYGKTLDIEIDKSYGQKLYDRWKSDVDAGKKETVLYSINTLKEFMKGIYVTSDFASEGMIETPYSSKNIALRIYYSINLIRKNSTTNVADSVAKRILPFPIGGAEAIRLNHITNPPVNEILGNASQIGELNKTRSYIRTPAGVVTQINIPLKEIKDKGINKIGSEEFNINSAVYKLTGFTELEDKLAIKKRPQALLFINKDSLENFFLENKKIDAMHPYTKIVFRDTINNTYNFIYQNSTTVTNNISSLVNHYLAKDKVPETLEYLLIPLEYTTPVYGQTELLPSISNIYSSTAAIFRTGSEKDNFMTMSLIYTKHKGTSGNRSTQKKE